MSIGTLRSHVGVFPNQADADFDGFGDVCDFCLGNGATDLDGDGLCAGDDNCPDAPNPLQEDADFDGFGDVCDFCVGQGATDVDADSICALDDNCPDDFNPGQVDSDGDGMGDVCDPCNSDPTDFDFDGDDLCGDPAECPAGCDNCIFDFNPDQADGDGDGDGNVCDNCPGASNPTQQDSDFDGLGDSCDNCPAHVNPGQEDADSDGAGDACDPCFGAGTADTDGDGTCDSSDPCPNTPTLACATLFACTGGSASTLYRINPVTGVGAPVGAMGIGQCGGLAFDPMSEVLYAVGVNPSSFSNSLFTVDTSTGAATLVGPTLQSVPSLDSVLSPQSS